MLGGVPIRVIVPPKLVVRDIIMSSLVRLIPVWVEMEMTIGINAAATAICGSTEHMAIVISITTRMMICSLFFRLAVSLYAVCPIFYATPTSNIAALRINTLLTKMMVGSENRLMASFGDRIPVRAVAIIIKRPTTDIGIFSVTSRTTLKPKIIKVIIAGDMG